jgi:hypothetical protein
MRPRLALLAGLLLGIALFVAPTASARHKHPATPNKLTINVTENPITTGDAVTLYGQLQNVQNKANRTVVLWHRLPDQRHFTRVQTVKTDAAGFWKIDRADGVVITNRAWFVTVGRHLRSRVIIERVRATVSLSGPATALTNQRVLFTGHVDPDRHRGDRVFLQVQRGGENSDDYATIDSARIGAGSNYTIAHRFKIAGTRTLRVVFRGDRFNIRSVSDPITIDVSQRQNPNLTLSPDRDPITYGESVTLAGVLKDAAPGTIVDLYARTYSQGYAKVASTETGQGGAYSFTGAPKHNTAYQARSGDVKSAQVFEGVRDVVTLSASSTSTSVGVPVTFTGFVQPDKPGHVIYLQKKGRDGDFHTVQVSRVAPNSTYRFDHKFGAPGDKVVRVLIPGGPYNHRGISPPVTVTVTPKQQP